MPPSSCPALPQPTGLRMLPSAIAPLATRAALAVAAPAAAPAATRPGAALAVAAAAAVPSAALPAAALAQASAAPVAPAATTAAAASPAAPGLRRGHPSAQRYPHFVAWGGVLVQRSRDGGWAAGGRAVRPGLGSFLPGEA